MKRPYFNQFERLLIRAGTLNGDLMLFGLAWEKLKREIVNDRRINKILCFIGFINIHYDDLNPLWNNGTIYVYFGNKIIVHRFVEDFEDPYELIDKFKEKYNIIRVTEEHNNCR